MIWEGDWRSTLPLTERQVNQSRPIGIDILTINGLELVCHIMIYRGHTYAMDQKTKLCYSLVPAFNPPPKQED